MDVGYSSACAKVPRCTWSPIPPQELRGELFHHLTTNGGFVSFGIQSFYSVTNYLLLIKTLAENCIIFSNKMFRLSSN